MVDFLAGDTGAAIEMGARVAPLPRQLLGSPKGPVAFVGHVDRVSAVAFQSSFGMAGIAPYRDFTSWLRQKSATVGRALETMRENARSVGAQVAGVPGAGNAKHGQQCNGQGGRPQVGRLLRLPGFHTVGRSGSHAAIAF